MGVCDFVVEDIMQQNKRLLNLLISRVGIN